jgi:hypothetical protein
MVVQWVLEGLYGRGKIISFQIFKNAIESERHGSTMVLYGIKCHTPAGARKPTSNDLIAHSHAQFNYCVVVLSRGLLRVGCWNEMDSCCFVFNKPLFGWEIDLYNRIHI